ncbi:MAG: carboxypeptidase-like regulatory domain-containing protein, partial [Bacteroidota bacterium]
MQRLLFILFLAPFTLWSQDTVTGTVENDRGEKLFGATLMWEGTDIGAVANEDGFFEILIDPAGTHLIVEYVGYEPLRVEVRPDEFHVEIIIEGIYDLMTVEVAAERRDNFVSTVTTLNVETISSKELRKAPCCSLAESFETNGQ